jgi:multiple sugar transport system substrate-binding protein
VTEKVPEGRMRPERSEQDARTYPSDGWATPGPIEHELDFVGALTRQRPFLTPPGFCPRLPLGDVLALNSFDGSAAGKIHDQSWAQPSSLPTARHESPYRILGQSDLPTASAGLLRLFVTPFTSIEEDTMASRKGLRGITRREALKAGGAGLAVAAGSGLGLFGDKAPAFAQQRTVHVVQWSHFIPQTDQELHRQVAEFEKASGIKVTNEHINLNDITARASAAIESRKGADIFQLQWNQAHLFAAGLDDHTDLWEQLGGKSYYPFLKEALVVDGVPRGMPYVSVAWGPTYRKDYLKEAGVTKIPDTWDELLTEGAKLKKYGKPVGQTLGHTVGDAPFFSYSLLWGFGGMETDSKQKVIINSKETLRSIEYMKELWFAACDEGGLAWDDGSNNRAFLAETIAYTGNANSIWYKAKFDKSIRPGLAEQIGHSLMPKGPAGRFMMCQPYNHCITSYSPNKAAAREYLKWIMRADNYGKWFETNLGYTVGPSAEWEKHPMWDREPAVTVFRDTPKYGRNMGHAGPHDRKSSEVQAKYIITDMYARAVKGESAKDAVAWAEKELKLVYGA